MQSKLTRIFAIVLVITTVCSLFAGCAGKEPSPADTIDVLEKALNDIDTEAFLRCLDSTWAEQLRPILELSVGEDGISAERFLAAVKYVLPVLPLVSKGAIQAKDLPKITLTVHQIDQEEDQAVVSLTGILSLAGYSKSFSTTVRMRRENEAWVICGVQ